MSEPISGKSLHGYLDTIVLAVLDKAEGHGFDVWKRLEGEGQGGLKLNEGSLYPALYRLKKAGLLVVGKEVADTAPWRELYRSRLRVAHWIV